MNEQVDREMANGFAMKSFVSRKTQTANSACVCNGTRPSRLIGYTAILLCGLLKTGSAGEGEPNVLEATKFGFPTAEKVEAARKINELTFFQGRLYLGHGDWSRNTGPTDILYYDFQQRKFVTEFTADEEAIVCYRQFGNRLFLPGVDGKFGTDSWEFGNLYVLEGDHWRKHRTIPFGIHVFDFAEYSGRWYVASASYIGPSNQGPSIGTVYSSGDRGKTWRYEFTTPSVRGGIFRIHALVSYKEKLYAFANASGPVSIDSVPEKYRSGRQAKTKSNGKKYYANTRLDDPFGDDETIVYDGVTWSVEDLVDRTNITRITPYVFADSLVLAVARGKYGLAFRGGVELHVWDGKSSHRLQTKIGSIVDGVVKADRLLFLVNRNGKYFLTETNDLKTWRHDALPPEIKKPLSIEHNSSGYFIGLTDGTIWQVARPGQQKKELE